MRRCNFITFVLPMEIRIKLNKTAVVSATAFVLATGFTVYDELFEYSKNLEIFSAAYKEVGKNFVDDVKAGDLMRKGLDAMLESLDPYTVYYSESQTEEAMIERQGEYGGVGCRVIIRNSYPMVTEVFAGYAFHEADIRPGDLLKTISGSSMKGKTTNDVSVFLRGAPNTTVNLVIERDGKELSKVVTRKEVRSKNVPYYGMIDDQTGYVKLENFGQNAAAEIQSALVNMNKDGKLKSVILDLRDNGGGLLHEAVNIVGLFVGPDQLVVTMRGRTNASKRDWKTSGSSAFTSLPLVVLVNSRSASASEVVSGSLQDLDRAVVIGRQSFGKGLVQNFFPLPYRSQMKITTAKYYTPSGRCIQLLDYSRRNADGSAGIIPDSLRKKFKTRNGRIVSEGGGIYPDLKVDEFGGEPLLKMIVNERIVFDYANKYRNTHETLENPVQFGFNERDMDDFTRVCVNTLGGIILKKYKESMLKSVPDSALVDALVEKSGLQETLNTLIPQRLEKFMPELEYRLREEVISRYHNGALYYESTFAGDMDVQEALSTLKNKTKYNNILKP